jgi:nucleoside recognition membrane protein YjiH
MRVGLITWKFVAPIAPKRTSEASVKLAPMIVTTVPPAVGPVLGLSELTVGSVVTYVNRLTLVGALVLPEVVTVT